MHSSDDDSKNLQSSLASPTQAQAQAAGMEDTNTKFSTPRTQYLQKRRQILQIGGRGSESGKFTWPRGENISIQLVVQSQLVETQISLLKASRLAPTTLSLSLIHQIIAFRFSMRQELTSASLEHMATATENLTGELFRTVIKNRKFYIKTSSYFDSLAGVAINRIGQFIIADRYNHRIQVFDPSGKLT